MLSDGIRWKPHLTTIWSWMVFILLETNPMSLLKTRGIVRSNKNMGALKQRRDNSQDFHNPMLVQKIPTLFSLMLDMVFT